MEIRVATEADVPTLLELATGLHEEDIGTRDSTVNATWISDGGAELRQYATEADHCAYLAIEEGEPVGYAIGKIWPTAEWRPIKRSELMAIYVKPEHRSKSIGEELVRVFRDWAIGQGAAVAAVVAYASNDKGIHFYERVGFVPYALELEMPLPAPVGVER